MGVLFELLDDTEELACQASDQTSKWNASPARHAASPYALRTAGTGVVECGCVGALADEKPKPRQQWAIQLIAA
jgi:hypothetical protein